MQPLKSSQRWKHNNTNAKQPRLIYTIIFHNPSKDNSAKH